jgi:hypothetical protein
MQMIQNARLFLGERVTGLVAARVIAMTSQVNPGIGSQQPFDIALQHTG